MRKKVRLILFRALAVFLLFSAVLTLEPMELAGHGGLQTYAALTSQGAKLTSKGYGHGGWSGWVKSDSYTFQFALDQWGQAPATGPTPYYRKHSLSSGSVSFDFYERDWTLGLIVDAALLSETEETLNRLVKGSVPAVDYRERVRFFEQMARETRDNALLNRQTHGGKEQGTLDIDIVMAVRLLWSRAWALAPQKYAGIGMAAWILVYIAGAIVALVSSTGKRPWLNVRGNGGKPNE